MIQFKSIKSIASMLSALPLTCPLIPLKAQDMGLRDEAMKPAR